jgi:predicted nuclease of predicted toxin-antitoxin system
MRFLADECCDRELVLALRSVGHDVRYAAESNRGFSDSALLEIAIAEDRILLTEDKDFGDLAVRRALPVVGVVLVRISSADASKNGRVVLVLANASERLSGSYTVIQASKVRFRPVATRLT